MEITLQWTDNYLQRDKQLKIISITIYYAVD